VLIKGSRGAPAGTRAAVRATVLSVCLLALSLGAPGAAQAQSAEALSKQKAQAAQEREALKRQIDALQTTLEAEQSRYKAASDALQSIETAISTSQRQLKRLDPRAG